MPPSHDQGVVSRLRRNGPEVVFLLLVLALAGFVLAFSRLGPAAGMLPALSVLTVLASLTIAGIAWMSSARRGGETISYWDVAGGFMLIGISAALLADGETFIAIG